MNVVFNAVIEWDSAHDWPATMADLSLFLKKKGIDHAIPLYPNTPIILRFQQ